MSVSAHVLLVLLIGQNWSVMFVKRIVVVLAMLCVLMLISASTAFAAVIVTDEQGLRDAIALPDADITLGADILLTQQLLIDGYTGTIDGANFTITSDGTFTLGTMANPRQLVCVSNSNMTFKNINIVTGPENTHALNVYGGTMTLNNVMLKRVSAVDNFNPGSGFGVPLNINGATVTVEGPLTVIYGGCRTHNAIGVGSSIITPGVLIFAPTADLDFVPDDSAGPNTILGAADDIPLIVVSTAGGGGEVVNPENVGLKPGDNGVFVPIVSATHIDILADGEPYTEGTTLELAVNPDGKWSDLVGDDGDTGILTGTVWPEDADDRDVEWAITGNAGVVDISFTDVIPQGAFGSIIIGSGSGSLLVTAIAPGTTVITASWEGGEVNIPVTVYEIVTVTLHVFDESSEVPAIVGLSIGDLLDGETEDFDLGPWQGRAFLGWFTAATGGDLWDIDNESVLGAMDLYARWADAGNGGGGGTGGGGNGGGGTLPDTGDAITLLPVALCALMGGAALTGSAVAKKLRKE